MDLSKILNDPLETPVEEPSLRMPTKGVPDHAAIVASVPEVQVREENRFRDFDLSDVTHVCVQTTPRIQTEVFRRVGYIYNWDIPGPYRCFLGKMVAKALFEDRCELEFFNYVEVRRQELIAYTTSMWRAEVEAREAAGVAKLPPLNVIEIIFNDPVEGKPLEAIWIYARDLIEMKVMHWNEEIVERELVRADEERRQRRLGQT